VAETLGKRRARVSRPFAVSIALAAQPPEPHFTPLLEPEQSLGHGVYLVVILAVREHSALLDEVVHPWRYARVRKIHVAAFNLRRNGGGARDLAALGIHGYQARYLVLQRLNDR
jgi:hypothetical protein